MDARMRNNRLVTVLAVAAAVIACVPSSTDAELVQNLAMDPPDDQAESQSNITKQRVRPAAGAGADTNELALA